MIFPYIYTPSGKGLHNYGKSPFIIGKSTISIVMFNHHLLSKYYPSIYAQYICGDGSDLDLGRLLARWDQRWIQFCASSLAIDFPNSIINNNNNSGSNDNT